MRNAQQCKAKEEIMGKLDDKTAFWLKDFSKKVLPMEFRETQKNYFRKKGTVYACRCHLFEETKPA